MEPQPSSPFALSPSISIIVAGLIIAGAVVLTNRQPAPQAAADAPARPAASPVTPDAAKVRTDGDPYIGRADAPVTMAYWYDYQCPFCQRNEEEVVPQIVKNYVDAGKLRIVFKDYQFLGPDSQTLGQFARAVWAAAPDKFYQWHKAIYDGQGTENTGWATKEKILAITTSVLGPSDAARVSALVKSNGAEYQKEIDADKTEGSAMGITGTPAAIIGTQLISGAQPYAAFQASIEAALTNTQRD